MLTEIICLKETAVTDGAGTRLPLLMPAQKAQKGACRSHTRRIGYLGSWEHRADTYVLLVLEMWDAAKRNKGLL